MIATTISLWTTYIYAVIKNKAIEAYLTNLVGELGVQMIEHLSTDELTDQEIATETGSDLNLVRRTLSTLNDHRLAYYVEKRDKTTGWITYRWHVNLRDIQDRLANDAKKLIDKLQIRLMEERNNVYYACENNCGSYLFEIASDTDFKCPVCSAPMCHQDHTELIEAMEQKMSELKAEAHAIFYPENFQILQLALAQEE
ncbi:MAG TPA: hypothetical protein VEG44_07485 [Candidatus Acidoferrales bacterium]|nr:hypothetical protein [Candidatus Acidoferrales bacterium]